MMRLILARSGSDSLSQQGITRARMTGVNGNCFQVGLAVLHGFVLLLLHVLSNAVPRGRPVNHYVPRVMAGCHRRGHIHLQ